MWSYRQPTEIVFGCGVSNRLQDLILRLGTKPIVVTDPGLRELPMTKKTLCLLDTDVCLFSDVEPNPSVGCVDLLAETIRRHSADVVIALGGGSSLDCAKAACSVACQEGPTRKYHSEGAILDSCHLPLIAMPTTAGTGSEVTAIAVLDDPDKGLKAPLVHNNFYPEVALVDPELTLTMPRQITAATGLDALAHAIEGYWSKNHQPICDLMALEAVRLVITYLPVVLNDGNNLDARKGMSMAALLGGLAFQIPKNAAVHACSYPLSSKYHLSHGTACAMTLDHFVRFNAPAMGERGTALAQAAGMADLDALADAISRIKADSGLPISLGELGIGEQDIEDLVEASFHPLIKNNPRDVNSAELRELYMRML